MTYKKKLIEVALPLEAINRESAREKSIRHGHPSTLHLWWARRPLAACRAVLFASLVDDPSAHPEQFPTEEVQQAERERLFRIIEELVKWENTTNETVLRAARAEILRSCEGNPPPVLDPFCGGGSIPLEAQRLGLEAHASDLNPVAVLISKALIELPSKFASRPPIHPEDGSPKSLGSWTGAQGLAEDVRWYGKWLRDEAERRIGLYYPKAKLPPDQGGGDATVIAWIWARTVRCRNPACRCDMPLVSSFVVSTKKGRERWAQPAVDRSERRVHFSVQGPEGSPPPSIKLGQGAKFACIFCGTAALSNDIHEEFEAGRSRQQLLAIVVEGKRQRQYVSPSKEHEGVVWDLEERIAELEESGRLPTEPSRGTFGGNAQGRRYGLRRFADYFTPRQLVLLTTLVDLIGEAREHVKRDAQLANGNEDPTWAESYAGAVAVYLSLAVSRLTDSNNSLCSWSSSRDQTRSLFARQGIAMAWDFVENNPFAGAAGDLGVSIDTIARAIEKLPSGPQGTATQADATNPLGTSPEYLVATDPPYYDNIGYADLADFFYVWQRRALKAHVPDLFETLLTPKTNELIASPYRFNGSREAADAHFEGGLLRSFSEIRKVMNPEFPFTVFYAFKQAEDDGAVVGLASTGWETMLDALLDSGFVIDGTWPMRTERGVRSVAIGTAALASSIVLVARQRSELAPLANRKEFVQTLKAELPRALRHLQQGNIAPVDLAQAAIGPGMGVFSRYSKVVEADGRSMTVRTALGLINQVLDETLAEQESDFDADTRWALSWFEQFGMNPGPFGSAETLSKAKNTAVNALVAAGFLESKGGKVRLLDREELASTWDPATDTRLTVWEVTQHLMRVLESSGEAAAAELLRRVGGLGETARELAYRLYVLCERKKWAKEALAYNGLVVAWPEVARLAAGEPVSGLIQDTLL